MAYKLSSILVGHSLDVRSLTITHDNSIISASRDKTAMLWKANGFNAGFTCTQTFRGHSNFVSAVCALSPSSLFPSGIILTGGHDKKVNAYTEDRCEPFLSFEAHEGAVSRIAASSKGNTFLTSSWDKTAKVWNLSKENAECLITLSGHEAAVWSVLHFKSDFILTASADKTVRVYTFGGIYVRTLKGHEDCVRDIAQLNSQEIVSCSNDATVRRWKVSSGECLQIIYGHPNYIYCVSTLNDLIVSGGEDRWVNVYVCGETQCITVPAISVWAVALLENGDIVTGTSDGIIRIFSADSSRYASAEILEAYEAEINQIKDSNQDHLGGLKLSDVKGLEALQQPGVKEDQTLLVKESNGAVACYSWSAANGWTKIGDVVGANEGARDNTGGGKVLFEGKEYDYVFDVDIAEGQPSIKLPYNVEEDPWMVAQKFIEKHGLYQSYLDQVANFIISNAKKANKDEAQVSSQYFDPFTGGSRYVPGSGGAVSNGTTGVGADPFTGASRYVPSMTASNAPAAFVQKVFPQTSYVKFEQANKKLMTDKLLEFNSQLESDGLSIDSQILTELISVASDLSANAAKNEIVQAMAKLLFWPTDKHVPVLDLLRLAVRREEFNHNICNDETFVSKLLSNCEGNLSEPHQIMSLRVLSNAFSQPVGEALVLSSVGEIATTLWTVAQRNCSKVLQVALSTLLLNMSIGVNSAGDRSQQDVVWASLTQILPRLSDEEALLRSCVAVGTMLVGCVHLKAKVNEDAKRAIKECANKSNDKLKVCAQQLLQMVP